MLAIAASADAPLERPARGGVASGSMRQHLGERLDLAHPSRRDSDSDERTRMSRRRLILAGLVSCFAIGVPPASADPDPENNKQALVRTLQCDNGQTIVASFAGLEGSNFNVTTDERVFVYKWIHIDRPRAWPPRRARRASGHVPLYDGVGKRR
jgi:hypothetical protein